MMSLFLFIELLLSSLCLATAQLEHPVPCPIILPPSAFFPSEEHKQHSSPVTPEVTAQLESTISTYLARNPKSVQQYAISVVHDGQTVFSSGQSTAKFRVGSVTKVFTALGALILRERGLLSLDDPVHNFLPTFSIINPFGEPHNTTLRELMAHSSGLPRELCADFSIPPGQSSAPHCPVKEGEVLELVGKMQLIRPPWSLQPAYSNLGFALLGHAWEKATCHCAFKPWVHLAMAVQSVVLRRRAREGASACPCKSWKQFVMEEIVAPLGMSDTGVDLTSDVVLVDNDFPTARDSLGWIDPAGQMYSTANDLAKFLVFLLEGSPTLIPQVAIREWTQTATTFADGQGGFALPWELQSVDFIRDFLITKGGAIANYRSIIAFHPPTQLGIAALFATNDSTTPLELACQLLGTLVLAVEASYDESIYTHYNGVYACNSTPPIPQPALLNTTIQVLGGSINVTSNPSTGLSATFSLLLDVGGQQLWQLHSSHEPLLLKNATDNSFWFFPTTRDCASLFERIGIVSSFTDPNFPGSEYANEISFDLAQKVLNWPFAGGVCVRA